MIFSKLIGGNKNRRKSKDEQWGWWEDPYKSTTSEDWYQEVLESHGENIPAPSPKYGTMPPVHTGTQSYA